MIQFAALSNQDAYLSIVNRAAKCAAKGGIVSGKAVLCYTVVSACFFTMVLSATLIEGIIGIQFMKSVDREYIARASAVFNSLSTAAMPIGSLLVSILVSHMATDKIILSGFGAGMTWGTVLLEWNSEP